MVTQSEQNSQFPLTKLWSSRGGEPIFLNSIELASGSGMTHLIYLAAHLVKTRDAGWVSKLPELVKLLQGHS